MSNFTCKGCGSRFPGCHSRCEKYIAEKKAWDEKMAEYRKQYNIKGGLDEQMYDGIRRGNRKKGRQGASRYGGQ